MYCSPDALERAERDQRAEIGRDAAQQRGEREQGEPGDERAAVAEAIAQGAGGEQQAREQEGVAVHHPLHAGDAGAEAARHVGQGDVDDGRVEHGHEVADADGRQNERMT